MKTVCVQDDWLPESSSMVEHWEGVVLEVYLLLYIFIIVLNMLLKMENLNSFRHESYARVQTAPMTKVLLAS